MVARVVVETVEVDTEEDVAAHRRRRPHRLTQRLFQSTTFAMLLPRTSLSKPCSACTMVWAL